MTSGFERPRPHSWQGGRWKAPLDGESFKLDERRLDELIAFTAAFSHSLEFRDAGGEVGRWDTFFLGDPARSIPGDISFIIADMASANPKDEYIDEVGYFNEAKTSALLKAIHHSLKRLDLWRERLALAKAGKPAKSVEATLAAMVDSLIEGDKKFDTVDLRALVHALSQNPKYRVEWSGLTNNDGTSPYWTEIPKDDNPFAPPAPLEIYGRFNRTTRIIGGQAAASLQDSLQQQDHAPHAALVLSFLQLFSRVRDDANKFTERHLNFYFRRILQLSERPSEPDRAHVYVAAAPNARPFVLGRGALLDAGSDAAGAPIRFALDDDLEIGQDTIARVASLSVRRVSQSVASILAWPIANSRDGFGAAITDPNAGWSPFPGDCDPAAAQALNAIEAEVGVLVRSSCLLLTAGAGRVTATLVFASNPSLAKRVSDFLAATRAGLSEPQQAVGDEEIVASAFRIAFQGATDNAILKTEADLSRLAEGRLSFVFALGPDEAGLVGALAPALRITINPTSETRLFAYSFFAGLVLTAVELQIAVQGLAPLKLQTANGPLDASKPFAPFGPLAPCGAFLLFSHPDLRGKTLDELTLNLRWANLPVPPATLENVYAAYGNGLTNDAFRGALSVLENYRWRPVAGVGATSLESPAFPLFAFDGAGAVEPASWSFDLAPLPLATATATTPSIYDPSCKDGFFRLQLVDPPIGFGQQIYPELLTSTVLANANADSRNRRPVPAPPVAPMIAAMSVDYTAHAILAVERAPLSRDPARDEGIFRFGPFAKSSEIVDQQFLPDFAEDGYLWLGVRNLNASRNLSLLFNIQAKANDAVLRMSGGTAAGGAAPAMRLRYYSGQAWKDLPASGVIRDTTEQLSRPGLMTLQIPADASGAPAASAETLTWLQFAVLQRELYGRILDLQCAAATATRVGASPASAGSPVLPPNTILGLTPKNPNVLRVGQPFATENGRLAEDERQFQIRVSERLGHKQRAILPRDYELLILEKFPNIGDARCLTRKEANLYGAPRGQVVVVVAPLRTPGAGSLAPCVPEYMLRDIGDYLLQKCPASVEGIVVRNPQYEALRVSAWLKPATGDRTAVLRQARDAIDGLIAPWRDDPKAPLPIGCGNVDLADLLGALGGVAGKPEVYGLSMVHFYRDAKPLTPDEEAASPFHRLRDTARLVSERRSPRPRWPWSVLIPATDPQLQWLDGGGGIGELGVDLDFALAWNPQTFYKPPARAGIGNLKVDVDFLVQAGLDNLMIENDFCVG